MKLPNTNTESYYRASLGMKDQIAGTLAADYQSAIVRRMKENGYRLQVGSLEFRLAREFGFCYGVDKAVDLAYEARTKFPDRRIFITHEIIHNPRVNARLRQMGICFLTGGQAEGATLDDITQEDVVIIPAFGVSTDLLQRFLDKKCILVDTTCGSVIHVWKRVEKFAREGFTSLIHGKHQHEETVATKSRAIANQGHYLVVRDLEETDAVCSVIRGEGGVDRLVKLLETAASPGFDPRHHLVRIGCANQTTMLSSESLEVGRRVRQALSDRYGEAHIEEHFRTFDTICSATQERQDAVREIVREGLDLMLVVGGYNSSNTGHLCELAQNYCPAYHIDDASAILSAEELSYKPVDAKDPVVVRDWLPPGPAVIGITAGASTPNRAIGQTIYRLLQVRGIALPADWHEGEPELA